MSESFQVPQAQYVIFKFLLFVSPSEKSKDLSYINFVYT